MPSRNLLAPVSSELIETARQSTRWTRTGRTISAKIVPAKQRRLDISKWTLAIEVVIPQI